MYEAFYGFKEKPFSMLPDPSFLFLSKKHQMAMTLLEYGLVNHVGFCVISGEPGAGKTTILRALLERVPVDITVGLITNTHQTFGGLLDWILSAFGLHQQNLNQVEMHQIFMDFLIEEYANKRTVLLIVDEAQNMKEGALEELRMLSNINTEKDQLLQVILSGQPALKEILRKPELMQFAQRIAVDYHLETLSAVETCGYIQHRLVTAGAERNIFTPAACERIHCYSGGTPRLINLLCETVLVYGFADQQDTIDVDLVDEMVVERMKDSVVPIVNRNAAKKSNKAAALALEKDFPWIKPKTEGLAPSTILALDEKSQEIEQKKQSDLTVAVEPAVAESVVKQSDAISVEEPEVKQVVTIPVDEPEVIQPETPLVVEPDVRRSSVETVVVEKQMTAQSKKKEEVFKPVRSSRRRRSRKAITGGQFFGPMALAGIIVFVIVTLVWSLSTQTNNNKMIDSATNKESVRVDAITAIAEQVKHNAEGLTEERLLMEMRLEEERLLIEQQEVQRVAREWMQKKLHEQAGNSRTEP